MQPIFLDIYDLAGNFLGVKGFGAHLDRTKSIIEWLRGFYDKKGDTLAYMKMAGSDIQHNNTVNLDNTLSPNDIKKHLFTCVSAQNLLPMSVYFAVRLCIKPTWINDRDQFYAPYNDTWQHDLEFLHDCLAFMLLHTQNRISCVHGDNHFIPFSETSINAKATYKSHALLDFLKGKKSHLFSTPTPLIFSPLAQEVLQAGQALYAYYHHQAGHTQNYNPNAGLYDIKEFFSGRNARGVLNPPSKSKDEHYKTLYATLKDTLNALAKQIQPKVWAYGFLREDL
ncbi:nucleoside 5-triphosphatase RdgB (dHAPTP, dITP,XTP-specific) [Helicobacter mehlei]|uniref:nucleoside 5-triphosphatase RdgB (dHAPTP, dITP,XTP-specific) n=1 Tax=Helicobacter mehlei TaxID=2316080 RepID=UPI000EB54D49|nr:nucleoside 5-triphosphatase RdgB (dHAPTP, dITP,XTP-specific) [Helicobacter mehlei]